MKADSKKYLSSGIRDQAGRFFAISKKSEGECSEKTRWGFSRRKRGYFVGISSLFVGLLFFGSSFATIQAATPQEIAGKEKEIADLDKKIQALSDTSAQKAGEVKESTSTVDALRKQLQKARLELERTQATISTVRVKEEQTGDEITASQEQLEVKREQLRHLIRELYIQEQENSITKILLSSFSVSDIIAAGMVLEQLQKQVSDSMNEINSAINELQQKQGELRDQQESLSQLQEALAVQKDEIAEQEAAEKSELNALQAEKAQTDSALAAAKQAREEIAKQVFSLKSSKVEVSFSSAQDMAAYAGKLTGVRPALLMAILRVESNLGNNVGSGVFPDDMQPASRDAFIRITDKLGIDRKTAQISRRPPGGGGWGGAIGPAQFMPATWEGIEPRIEQLMGKSPVNPYELSDAFVGTAVYVADRGAARGAEREALARYVAGPYWEYHVSGWYVERVLAVAAEYEKEF